MSAHDQAGAAPASVPVGVVAVDAGVCGYKATRQG